MHKQFNNNNNNNYNNIRKEQELQEQHKVQEEFEKVQVHLRVLLDQQHKLIQLEQLVYEKQNKLKNKKFSKTNQTQNKNDCLELQGKLDTWIKTECTLLDKWYGKGLTELHGRLQTILKDCLDKLE